MRRVPAVRPSRLWPFNLLLLPVVLALGLVVASLLTDGSDATYIATRAAPAVSLSNGGAVTLFAELDGTISDVAHVAYTLHVPAGMTARRVAYDRYRSLETVSVVPDLSGSLYRMVVRVTSRTQRIGVSAYAGVTGYLCSQVPSTANGRSGDTLISAFDCPYRLQHG